MAGRNGFLIKVFIAVRQASNFNVSKPEAVCPASGNYKPKQ